MPWKGVTVSEQRERFIEDYLLNYYTVSELAERFSITRKTAHKWIKRFKENGKRGLEEQSRRPKRSPRQTDAAIVQKLVAMRKGRPSWGPRKLLDKLEEREPGLALPGESTVVRILAREGLVKPRRRRKRRLHPGCPQSVAREPNEIWAADYKGQFRLKNGGYCFPLTVSDLASRYVLGVEGHAAISLEKSFQSFRQVFERYGLPQRIRTDNGVPFASNALARLSQLSVWWIQLGIYPELIEPGQPQQNGVHERMHRTLKQEATIPPGSSLRRQQQKFDDFREDFNQERPHEALGMKRPGQVYERSPRRMPTKIEAYDYPGHYLVRRVSRAGTMRVFKQQVFVSQTLKEEYVGLEEVGDGVYDVYYRFYQIGRYELRTNKMRDIISRVGLSMRRAGQVGKV